MKKTNILIQAAFIAAIYAALTLLFAPISYGQIQVRIAEALTVLPYFTKSAIPGLYVGCIVANIYGGGGIIDIVVGSLATLFAAYLSSKMKKRSLISLPPVIVNGIIIGAILHMIYDLPLLITMGWVALGQLIACYGLGYPLIRILERYKEKLFES